MNRACLVSIGAVLLLSGAPGVAQQPATSDAVLIRDGNNQLLVSAVVAGPGDTVAVTGGQVMVNGRATAVRVQVAGDWGPRQLEAGTYFVAGDPAGLGRDQPAWGLIPESRIVGTVRIGALPAR